MGGEFLRKNASHRPVSLPGMLLFQRRFWHIFLVKTGYLVSQYINNVYVILSFHLIFIVILTYSQETFFKKASLHCESSII